MISISTGLFCNTHCRHRSPLHSGAAASRRRPPSGATTRFGQCRPVGRTRRLVVRGCGGDGPGESEAEGTKAGAAAERRSFLTLEEAGLIEVSGLSTHERFLCRLTIDGVEQAMLENADIVVESAESGGGARGLLHRGAERREGVRLVLEGQAEAGAES
ncbi:hypothetical protein BT93_G0232 [Corymbia citriodora subsp. variegata]|nr:hypothetical protein BT93_G0232 [Corymbia citriodora subsp. variegata]